MRYVVEESEERGLWYVYDTVRNLFVCEHRNRGAASAMASDLNRLHEKHAVPVGIAVEVVQRVRVQFALEEMEAEKHSQWAQQCLEARDGRGAAENGMKAREASRRASDIRALLTALGVSVG